MDNYQSECVFWVFILDSLAAASAKKLLKKLEFALGLKTTELPCLQLQWSLALLHTLLHV